MKRKVLFLLALLILQGITLAPVHSDPEPPAYTIDGDSVYIDDDNVFLNVTPHTIVSDTDVEFQLLSKTYTGNIDIALGVNSSNMRPKNPRLWNGTHFNPWDVDFETISYDFQEFDTWFVATDLPVVQDQLYKMLIEIDVKFNTKGKYFFAVKPSGETISQAVANGHFYYLDPWWDTDWSYNFVVKINTSYVDEILNNFPVYIPINTTISGDCQPGGTDIRFVATDNNTEYNFEIVNWTTSENSEVWVNITNISIADPFFRINVYYGNAAASNASNPYGTWDASKYLAVWHCNSNTTLGDSTSNNINGSTSNFNTAPGKIGRAINSSGNNRNIGVGDNCDVGDTDFTLEAWVYTHSNPDEKNRIFDKRQAGGDPGYFFRIGDTGTGEPTVETVDSGQAVATISNTKYYQNAWHFLNATNDETKNELYLCMDNDYQENSADSSAIGDLDNTHILEIGHDCRQTYLDELRISKVKHNSSWLDAQFDNINNTAAFLTFTGSTYTSTPNLTTNETQYVNLTNAELNGWGNNDFATGTYYPGFWIGRTSPVDADNADQNISIGLTLHGEFKYQITNLLNDTVYYVKAWGFDVSHPPGQKYQYAPNQVSFRTGSRPDNPTSISTTIVDNTYIDFSWTNGTRGDRTVIVRKTGSYPTSVSDGTLIFNNTNTTFRQDLPTTQYFYKMYAFNETWGIFSLGGSEVSYGGIYINCFDEDTSSNLTFDVFISNQSGSETYQSTHCTNTHRIDIADTPQGDDVIIQISANESYANVSETFTGYDATEPGEENETITYVVLQYEPISKDSVNVTCYDDTAIHESYPAFTLDSDLITIGANDADNFTQINVTYVRENYATRFYTMDIVINVVYTIDCYLPPYNLKQLYLLQVIDETGQSVKDANITVKRYIDGAYQNVSILKTNGNGYASVYLIPEVSYKFEISKSGYETDYADWEPSSQEQGHTFQLTFEDIDLPSAEDCGDAITFESFLNLSTEVLCINVSDKLNEFEDLTIKILEYDYDAETESLLATSTELSDDFTVCQAVNISNGHRVVIFYNHTTCGSMMVTIWVERNETLITTQARGDDLFHINYGHNPFGWSNFFTWLALLGIYFSFGQRGAGISLIISGFFLLFINSVIGFNTIFTALAGGGIPILHIVVGFLVIWRDSNKEATSSW